MSCSMRPCFCTGRGLPGQLERAGQERDQRRDVGAGGDVTAGEVGLADLALGEPGHREVVLALEGGDEAAHRRLDLGQVARPVGLEPGAVVVRLQVAQEREQAGPEVSAHDCLLGRLPTMIAARWPPRERWRDKNCEECWYARRSLGA